MGGTHWMSLSTARLAADPEGSRCVPQERGSREDCQQSPRGVDCGCARVHVCACACTCFTLTLGHW